MAGCCVTGVQAVTGAWESAICAVRNQVRKLRAMTMWRADACREDEASMDKHAGANDKVPCAARFIISLSGVVKVVLPRGAEQTERYVWGRW
jgi:hypothetical protein